MGKKKEYIQCLQESNDVHHKCRDLSKLYLQCRMEHQLMAKEDLNHVRLLLYSSLGKGEISLVVL